MPQLTSVDPDMIYNPGSCRIVVRVDEKCSECDMPFYFRSYEGVGDDLVPDSSWCEKCTRRDMFTIYEFRQCGRIEKDLGYWSDDDAGNSGMLYEIGCDPDKVTYVIPRLESGWHVVFENEILETLSLDEAEQWLFDHARHADEI